MGIFSRVEIVLACCAASGYVGFDIHQALMGLIQIKSVPGEARYREDSISAARRFA
jgi:hypothetical protein